MSALKLCRSGQMMRADQRTQEALAWHLCGAGEMTVGDLEDAVGDHQGEQTPAGVHLSGVLGLDEAMEILHLRGAFEFQVARG